jgi:hypothetical protein
VLEWICDANEIKNGGLYVDFNGVKWTHPGNVSKKRFMFGYQIAEDLISEKGRFIRKILKTDAQFNEESKALIREIIARPPSQDPQEQLKYVVGLVLK